MAGGAEDDGAEDGAVEDGGADVASVVRAGEAAGPGVGVSTAHAVNSTNPIATRRLSRRRTATTVPYA